MKKRTLCVTALALCLTLALAACGGAGGQAASTANYIDVIRGARPAEMNPNFYIVADAATREGATTTSGGPEMTSEQDAQQQGFIFNDATGLAPEPMEKYAISLGFSITQAYGVAIILPKEGEEQAVKDMLNAYVLTQQKAQENYLPDQYAIAMAAEVKTAKTGEVLLAMCENQGEVIAAMEAGLQG